MAIFVVNDALAGHGHEYSRPDIRMAAEGRFKHLKVAMNLHQVSVILKIYKSSCI